MPRTPRAIAAVVPFLCCASLAVAGGPPGGQVEVIRAPEGGLQPQAAIDAEGAIHLVYFRGEAAAGDLFYVRSRPGRDGFSAPVRVNDEAGSAIAIGTIRGAQIALGRGGRVHVAWNGSSKARPANPNGGSPMLYARMKGDGAAFEPARNLMRRTGGLDGGGTVAADGEGHVYVGWHGRAEGAADGEAGRRFFVARSDNDGATFAPEEPALDRDTGACACCGSRALVDRRGTVYALYRAATEGLRRDMILLTSADRGAHFRGGAIHPWRVNVCPMSSESLAEGKGGVVAAWETEGQVFFSRIDPESFEPTPPTSPARGAGGRKHPAVAVNARGETILVWAEGTGWQRGGSLAWQVFDAAGRPTKERGRVRGGVPTWGLATVVARPDGGFTIIH